MTTGGRVVVQRSSGVWRWRYEELDGVAEPVVLPAAEGYPTQDQAAAAARTAYPDVPLEVEHDVRTLAHHGAYQGGRGIRSVLRHRRLVLGAAAVVVAVLVVRRRRGLRDS